MFTTLMGGDVASLGDLTIGRVAAGTVAYAAFFFAMLMAARVLPGALVQGFPQPDGARKHYVLNGMGLFVLTHMIVIGATLVFGVSIAPIVTEWFWPLFVGANIFSVAWTVVLYLGGLRRQGDAARSGRGLIHDLWMGVELNPTWRGVDLKTFAYQPSLIGLGLLVASFAVAQVELHGTLTPQMALYAGFWWLYLYTHYRDEAGILSMWDIIAEKFGFMLVWGDLVLVPFFYCAAGWVLLDQTEPASWSTLLVLAAVYALGLWIFRGANKQKHTFKLDPTAPIWGERPRLVGGRLLVSGWWGIGRKINYSSELMVYYAIAATAGFSSVVPFLVPIWLTCLLTHRAWRDEQRCAAKYGPVWDEYCRVARFRMIPGIY
jgi:delta14-sterol reductase